jgi:periplasmic mercuric ion binding protein
MKNRTILLGFLILLPFGIFAQGNRTDTIHITTSAQCGMCTERIEKTLTFEPGVRSAKLDLETGVVAVAYRNNRTSPDKIRKAISKVGHDADDVEADPEAYSKLPGCCKKPDDPDYYKHD